MAANKSMTDEIMGRAQNSRPGPSSWYDRLPEPLRNELALIRESFKRGGVDVQKYALAKSIRAAVVDRGYSCVNAAGVVRWLDQG
jgi:hypothetical protein